MSECLEGRTKHRFENGPECIHCHAPNPYTTGPAAPVAPGGNGQAALPLDGLDALKQEAQPPAPTRVRAVRKPSPEELARVKRQRENIVKLLAQIPHRVQASVAAMLYDYRGNAFNLTSEQTESLGAAWLSVLDAFDYDPTSPWVALAVLAATEAEISMGQWRRMYQDVEPATAAKEK